MFNDMTSEDIANYKLRVGPPCHRPGCEHGLYVHDENGCAMIAECSCGYYLQADLMTEVKMLSVWRNRAGFYNDEEILYGWLRVFEGYTDKQAKDLLRIRK